MKKLLSTAFILFMMCAGTVGLSHAKTILSDNPFIPATTQSIADQKKVPVQHVQQRVQQPQKTYIAVDPVDMVNYPARYMNKNVKFRAKFDKFATLGLDYKPAFRSSEKYISFLIQRGDVTTHNVPLSELKIFLIRTEAEKHIDLDSGDEIQVEGHVFSNALGDVWMDAEQFTVLTKKPVASARQ